MSSDSAKSQKNLIKKEGFNSCLHHHHHTTSSKKLFWAILINVILTFVQIIAGLFSGSLSLIADAIHNLSDAGSLVIAYIAEKISTKKANSDMTFGYGRSQLIGALINSITLIVIALIIIYEVFKRSLNPEPIDGWIVIWTASIAFIIDAITALLTHSESKDNINMRAAFIHNLSDAMASLVVILSGVCILIYQIYYVDLIASLIISLYILYQSYFLVKESLHPLMQGRPHHIEYNLVENEITKFNEVKEIQELYIWMLNEKQSYIQAKILLKKSTNSNYNQTLIKIKTQLKNKFDSNNILLELAYEE